MMDGIFVPGGTAELAVTGTTAPLVLPQPGNGVTTQQRCQMRIFNEGPSIAFVAFGAAGVTALVAGSMPIPPGNTEMFTALPAQTHLAAICRSGQTAQLYVTAGEGF